MTICCSRCGKSVSTEVPDGTIVRAFVECPECVANDIVAIKRESEELKERVKELKAQLTTPKKIEPVIEESEFEDLIKESIRQECPPGLSSFHPLTCRKNRHDEAHVAYQKEHGGDFGELVVTSRGLLCPVPGCGYTQNWRIQ